MTWWKAALGVLLVGLLAWGIHRWHSAVQRAEAADARADSLAHIARQDSAAAARAQARADSAQVRERAVRDSLGREIARWRAEAEASSEAVDVQTVALSETLAELEERVRPELRGLVRTARSQADSLSGAHHRFRRAMERQVTLLARDTASLRRELDAVNAARDSLSQALTSLRDAYGELETARDRWREAARLRLFGLPPEVTHAVAAGAGLALGMAGG